MSVKTSSVPIRAPRRHALCLATHDEPRVSLHREDDGTPRIEASKGGDAAGALG